MSIQGYYCQLHGVQGAGLSYCPVCAQKNSYQQVNPGLVRQLENQMHQLSPDIAKEMRELSRAIAEIKTNLNIITAERDRYKAALEFYADRNNWECECGSWTLWDDGTDENGQRARAALAEEKRDEES